MSTLSVPGFEILETLRETSKTVTVKAAQHSLNRTVVLTFLRAELASRPAEIARFLAIARACSQLKADGLPKIYDVVSDGAQPYLVTEWIEGTVLAHRVRHQGPLSIPQAAQLALILGDALNCAWQQGRLVYRNLKPTEICIDARGVPRLLDFHLATLVDAHGAIVDDTDAGMIVGTPNFLAPEQIRGSGPLDCRADMYALGATLYYAVTGHFPFEKDAPEEIIQKQITDQIPHPRTFRPDLPATLGGLITRLMMKHPEDRYSSWAEAMGDMQHVLKNTPLRRRETALHGISTIAPPPADAPAPDAPRLRLATADPATGQTAAPEIVAARPRRHGPSFVIRIALWTLLTAWLALLLNNRMGNPAQLPFRLPAPPVKTWLGLSQTPPPTPNQASAKPATPAPAPAPAETPAAPATAAPTPESATATATEPPAATPTPAPEPAAPAPAPAPAAPAIAPEAVKLLAAAFARGDLDGARAAITRSLGLDAAQRTALRDALAAIPDPQRFVEATLLQSRDQETTITYMGKERRVIPRRVINGEIEADFVAADGNRPVTFKTAKFSPDELLKILPADPETPAVNAAVCLVHLQAGHKDEVAKRSAKCGLLAPVFEAAAR